MTFIVPPSKEGQEAKCPTCKVEIIGRLTDYKGRFPDKLQWQDKDSRKAHYDKDGNCKDLTSSGTVHVSETTTVETSTIAEPLDPNVLILDLDSITSKYVDEQIHLIQEIEKKVNFVLGKDARGDKVGMYVKLILEGINRK